MSLLVTAAEQNNQQEVERILANKNRDKTLINTPNDRDRTALQTAAFYGYVPIL